MKTTDDIDDIFTAVKEEPEADQPAATSTPDAQSKEFRFEADISDTGIDPYDDSEAQRLINEEADKDMVAAPEAPPHMSVPVTNEKLLLDPIAPLTDEIERRFGGVFELDKFVKVTQFEREDFVRAALFDAELVFRIELPGVSVVMDVAIPPESFTVSAAAAARHWGKIGFNEKESDMQWLLSFQQLHAWFQIRSINGEPTSWSTTFCDGVPKLSDMRATMADPENFNEFFSMNATRWRMIVEAMRIAEYKYKLCLEAWHDRSFFTSAGTA